MSDAFPDEVDEALWDKACRRADAIRDFLKGRTGKMSVAEVALFATELEISQATAYRLIKLFRAGGTVMNLVERKPGRPEGHRVLDDRREEIIRTTINRSANGSSLLGLSGTLNFGSTPPARRYLRMVFRDRPVLRQISRIDRCSRKCQRRITLSNAMSISPEPPLKTCEGRLKHGSILNGNIWLRRVSSQWKSTEVDHLLVHVPGDYYPIFMHDKGKTIVDAWAIGFALGLGLGGEAWAPILLATPKPIITPIMAVNPQLAKMLFRMPPQEKRKIQATAHIHIRVAVAQLYAVTRTARQ